MKKRLTAEQAKSVFEARVNGAAKEIRAIAKIVEEQPNDFTESDVAKVQAYLAGLMVKLQDDLKAALDTTSKMTKSPFSLDGTYEVPIVKTIGYLTGTIDARTGTLMPTMDTPVSSRPIPPPTPDDDEEEDFDDAALEAIEARSAVYEPDPTPVGRRRAVGRLVGTKETVFALDTPATPRPTAELPSEVPDKTGGIKDFGFLDSE